MGWETFLAIMAVQATATVMGALGFSNHLVAQIASLVLVVVLAAGSGILGFDTIMKVQTWITWATAVLTLVYLVLVADKINFSVLAARPAASSTAVLGAGCMLAVGFGFGWVNAAADYSRYLPRNASTRGVVGWTTFGASLPVLVLVCFGVLLVGSSGAELSQKIGDDPIGALTTLLPTWFLIPFALVAILGLVGGIVMDIYSSGLSLLATGVPVSRPVATAIDGTIMTTLGVVIAAWAGVMLADIALRHKEYDDVDLFSPAGRYGSVNWGAMASLVVASFVGWGLVVNTGASWLSWQGYLLGPLGLGGRQGSWAGANLGILLALVIGFAGYWISSAKRVRRQEER